jgi:dTDP-4-dehydrorhamnose reductase
MKIFLTGAYGQVGRELLALAAPNIIMHAYGKDKLDVRELAALTAAVADDQPDIIINAAAYTAVDMAEQERELAFAVNSTGIYNLALVGKRFNIPIIHLSSDYVFNGEKTVAYDEGDVLTPINSYGASKAQGEVLLQQTWPKHLILRVSGVFGRYGNNFVKKILNLASSTTELSVINDQLSYPTAASSIAATVILLSTYLLGPQPHWGVFHYRGDQALSWYEFAQLIIKHAQQRCCLPCQTVKPIASAAWPQAALRPRNSLLNMTKIQTIYGIQAHSLAQSLTTMLNDCL